ncbi:DUF5343 domain-containing protein [Anthocerotibacter panamensis]|uniref:DUF5343 domain-containing protein n=1 Tax=Anthocerotibacter panamensis TaxID=2857077 RepID=UPI001C4035F9|nr:DUF5343 domain-containing protein [Anthocerotibacter panamensis]
MTDERKSFPKIPTKNWWLLRDHFKKTVPKTITDSFLASVLAISKSSTKASVLIPLRSIGFIDEQGAPTELVYDWRNDEYYSTVCKTIISQVYPQELLDAFPDPNNQSEKVAQWFMSYTRAGNGAVKAYTAFYLLLCKADYNARNKKLNKQKSAVNPLVSAQKVKARKDSQETHKTALGSTNAQTRSPSVQLNTVPSLHIDIQIHLSSDASAEQIDKVFASMARHLKDFQIPSVPEDK